MSVQGALARVMGALLLGLLLAGRPHADDAPLGPGRWTQIRIASEGARPPYNYFEGSDLAGFEIDLARDLCRRIGATCTFVAKEWDGMIDGLVDDQYDAIFAAMEVTDSRRERIAFSNPYVRMPSAFLTSKDSLLKETTPEALAGHTIGVEAGGPHEAFLDDLYKGSTIRPYATLEDAILDLANGRIDIALGDKDAVVDFLTHRKEGQCCQLVGDSTRDPAYFGDGIAIGLRKEDKDLKELFDKALEACMIDGTFATIAGRSFDFPIN